MKSYSTKSTAQRAAARTFNVANSAEAVAAVARVFDMAGEWFFEPLEGATETVVNEAPVIEFKAPKKKAAKPAPVKKRASATKKTWKRPGPDTVTGRVWELADKHVTRAKVMEAGIAEGICTGTLSQQYHRWNHQS